MKKLYILFIILPFISQGNIFPFKCYFILYKQIPVSIIARVPCAEALQRTRVRLPSWVPLLRVMSHDMLSSFSCLYMYFFFISQLCDYHFFIMVAIDAAAWRLFEMNSTHCAYSPVSFNVGRVHLIKCIFLCFHLTLMCGCR